MRRHIFLRPVWIGGFVVSLLVLAGVVLLRIFAYSAASDRAKEDGEIRTLLNLTRRNFQRIHSVEGAWEFQPYRYPGGRSSGRFAYRAPNLFREDGVQPFQSGETTMVGNDKEMWTFSPSAWSVSKSFPPLLPRVEYTPGAIDLTAVASRYRYARLVKDDIARKLGVRVIEFGEPKDADWCDSREVPDWCLFYVDAQTGAIRRCLVPEERIYEDWITVNGATIARRVRRIYGIGEQYVYKNLRINQNLPDERVRFVPPKGAAAFPLILSRYSLRAARRYVEQHPNDAGGHALYATLLTENWFSIPQLSYPGKGERQMQAETEIKKAIDLAPDVGAYRTIYASYAFRRKDYAEAERQLKAAVNACPQAIGFWNELARFYRERKDFHAAERVLRQSRERTQSNTHWADDALISLYLQQGRMETAMKTARSIAQRTKDVTWITRVLDAMAAKKSTAARAEAEYDRLLRDPALSDEEFTSVLSRLLDLRKRRSDTSDAKRTLAEAFNMRPVVTTRRIFFHLSLADYRPMLPNMARRLEMEAKRQPQNDSLKEWLVRTYEEMREPEKAARLYEEIAKTTDNYVFLSECARKMRSSGNKRGAWKMRIDFLHRHAERTDMRLEHFNLLRNDGRYQEALEVYGDPLRGLCASPFPARSNNLNANLNALLECYSKLGKLNEFARLIRHELIRHPEVFHLRLILGDVQTKAGNTAAAQETWLELARRKDLTRWQRILLAHRLETAGKLETALEQLLKAAELPVSRQERETITMNISIFIPWDQRQVQSQGKLLGDIMRLQGKLGQNSAAAATRRRIPMVGKALGLED